MNQERMALAAARSALLVLKNAVSTKDGEMTVSKPVLSAEDCMKGYFACKAIEDLLKTPVQNHHELIARLRERVVTSVDTAEQKSVVVIQIPPTQDMLLAATALESYTNGAPADLTAPLPAAAEGASVEHG